MYSLFRILFRSSYWRMLLRPATWREAGMSLRRAHKDKRARKHLLGVGLMLLIPFLCLAYAAWLAGSGALYVVPFVIPVIWWRARQEKRESESLSIAPPREPFVREFSAEGNAAMRRFLADTGLCLAVLLDRAGSESFLKHKELPEGIEVTSRRVHLALLQGHAIWDRMQPPDRLAMMVADGHWEWAQINQAARALEPLRLLRWMLRIDFYLPEIGQQLQGDYALAHELVTSPAKLYNGSEVIDWPTMVTGRETAQHYYYRCMAEAIDRGRIAPRNDEAAAWAKGISDGLRGKQDADLVLGTQLVSEVSDDLLGWAIALSEQRMSFLGWAMKIREKGTLPEDMPGVFEETSALTEGNG